MKENIHRIVFITFSIIFISFFVFSFIYTYREGVDDTLNYTMIGRVKSGNNGTVSCDTYCRGGWQGWQGTCYAAIDNDNKGKKRSF